MVWEASRATGKAGFSLKCALKIIFPETKPHRRAKLEELFQREATALSLLRHPCIVRVENFGELGDYMWLAMELVDGEDLSSIHERHAHLTERSPRRWRTTSDER